ncbi:hypothetical protein SPRG_02472 [Saprolegnia parasitica CBS 223.65]|uniref:MATE efflux family protein n=1 Tax=Saprolegnia parasitica (strain CBS 223.65) TaxID=695850 RepID=A0A067CQ18_SAPPC|nr:hypothetical protein SPRG_02472 [Saprolegnia parasitica CBS 223.65]KDO32774.1 hypothetical protein SPRG_02472 [Saprolegnia parasitica CBS 223.65]|eukprot:XP_012196438.1 hypothetical protein SPRG_02472 [Saprolegnia parasitica CBS 223.65]
MTAKKTSSEQSSLLKAEVEMYGTTDKKTDDAPAVPMPDAMIPVSQEIRELTSMAVQLSMRQMVRQAMTLTDAAFQGHIGTKQLAGVALAGMWMGVPSAFIQYSIQAIPTLCGQAYGAGNKVLVGIWLQTAVVFAIVTCIPVMVYYMFVGRMIALTMDDAETVYYGSEFAKVMALGLIPQFIYNACASYFAAQGIIMPATLCSGTTMLLNIFFNQLFIYGGFGYDGLGFIGSPIATVTSTYLQLILFLLYTVVWKKYHVDYWGGWSTECLKRERVQIFLSLAVPMGMSSVVDWSSAAVASAFSGFLGPQIAAAMSVLNGIYGVANSCVSGFSISTQIRMSRYLGQGHAVAAKRVLLLGARIVMCSALVLMTSVYFLRNFLFRVWSNDPEINELCASSLVFFILCVMVAFGRFLLTASMNALSMADVNLMANNVASWCIYVPLSYLLPITLAMGIDGFWIADTFGEMFKFVVLAWGLLRVDWQARAEQAMAAAEKPDMMRPDEEEARELVAYGNEALTPGSARSPSVAFTTRTPHTPTLMQRAMSLTPKRTKHI